MVAAAVVGAVGSVAGGLVQSSAAKSAAGAQRDAAAQANATEQGFFDTAYNADKPFIQTGQDASSKISDLEGLNGGTPSSIMSTLQGLPGYQFANQQGLKSVQNSATARGLGVSGASQKAAANFSTGLANQYYNNLLTGLQTTANTGAGSAASLGTVATNIGNQIGENTIGAGNATAAGDLASGSAFGNAINGVTGNIGNNLIASSLLQGIGSNPTQTNFLGNGVPDLAGIGAPSNGASSFGQIGTGLGQGFSW